VAKTGCNISFQRIEAIACFQSLFVDVADACSGVRCRRSRCLSVHEMMLVQSVVPLDRPTAASVQHERLQYMARIRANPAIEL